MTTYSFYTNINEMVYKTNDYELSIKFFDSIDHGNYRFSDFDEENCRVVYYDNIVIEIVK